VRVRAARDHDVADALRAQMLRRQRADLAGADDEHAPSVQVSENLARERNGREADRHRSFAERRFRAHALADAERPAERIAQHRPDATLAR
jgi:hypothetical protein